MTAIALALPLRRAEWVAAFAKQLNAHKGNPSDPERIDQNSAFMFQPLCAQAKCSVVECSTMARIGAGSGARPAQERRTGRRSVQKVLKSWKEAERPAGSCVESIVAECPGNRGEPKQYDVGERVLRRWESP